MTGTILEIDGARASSSSDDTGRHARVAVERSRGPFD
jgi:hypothetical protein